MPQLFASVRDGLSLSLRSFLSPKFADDPINIGLKTMTWVAWSSYLEILTFDAGLLWTQRRSFQKYKFGYVHLEYFGHLVQSIPLDVIATTLQLRIYFPVQFYENTDAGSPFYSYGLGFLRADTLHFELHSSIIAQMTVFLLESTNATSIGGVL